MNHRPVPRIGKPEYRVIFYHHITGSILKYKFQSQGAADDFYDKLDMKVSKPTMYKIERIR